MDKIIESSNVYSRIDNSFNKTGNNNSFLMTESNHYLPIITLDHHSLAQFRDLIASTLHLDPSSLDLKTAFRLTPTLSEESSDANLNSTHDDSAEDSLSLFPLHYNNLSDKQCETGIFNLDTFKVFPCQQRIKHNHKQCAFYHYPRDRRRPGHFSSNFLCKYLDNPRSCPKGDACPYDHSRVEQLYSPNKYKTKFCSFYPDDLHHCEFGIYCSFAHNENEIKIELIHNLDQHHIDFYMLHYKTVWCPFNLVEHDRARCVYAHNWQDFRRKPADYNYEASCCQLWKVSEFLRVYEDGGCPLGYECGKCHGWKELEYHPLNYKTKKCTVKKCLGGKVCPYYHTNKEKRDIKMKEERRPVKEKNSDLIEMEGVKIESTSEKMTISPSESEFEAQEFSQPANEQAADHISSHLLGQGPAHDYQDQNTRHHLKIEETFDGYSTQPKWSYLPETTKSPRFLGLPSCKSLTGDSDWTF